MNNKKTRIAQSFQRWLLVLVAIALLATTAFLWLIQTRLSENNAISLLELNLSDVKEDIIDAMEQVDSSSLPALVAKYDITEINVINAEGIITATTYPSFMDYDIRSGAQSAEFMVLLEGEKEYVQSYRPVSYDARISRKYGGVVLANGSFVQVGYGAARFRRDIDEFVVGVTRNRHVGEDGCIIIADEAWNIVSDRFGNEGASFEVTGVRPDMVATQQGAVFTAEVYGQLLHAPDHRGLPHCGGDAQERGSPFPQCVGRRDHRYADRCVCGAVRDDLCAGEPPGGEEHLPDQRFPFRYYRG